MKALSKKQFIEAIVGFALIALVLVLGFAGAFASTSVFVKCLIGLGFGYALTRGDFGFAGLSNRTCRKGSTSLIRALMLMFAVSAIIVGAFLLGGNVLNLWVNPISWGLLAGGILFGIGMAFSSCCATGVLQDFPIGFSRAGITLVFFGAGVFLGFPLMSSGFVRDSLFTSGAAYNGVWFPDWFQWDGANGIIGAILLTILLAVSVGSLAKWYEKKISKNFPKPALIQKEVEDESVWNKFFVKKWSMTRTALIIAGLFGLLYAVSQTGWGASTVYGDWFGTILAKLGFSLDALVNFTKRPESAFTSTLFSNAGYMQNVGIILGAIVGLLLSGRFSDTFKAGLKIKPLEILLFAVGGLLLGFGTRLSLGCNVGALYTPIANFSLAGWLYFFFLFGGGYLGNMIRKAFYKKVDPSKID
jgi:hypothetical protein